MSECLFVVGDTRDVTAKLPDASVDFLMTSPPFLALRSYLPADHPDKHREIGSEATPAEFLQVLLELTAEWGRVLAPHGSICVELGDTYSGSGGAGGDYGDQGLRAGQAKFRQVGSREHRAEREGTSADGGARLLPVNGGGGWPLDKSLCGIPHLYHLSLAYGRNLLTGEPSPAGQWRVRNVVAWCRPNPPVGALGDKFRPATSYLTIATRARDRWFDLDAVRQAPSANTHARIAKGAAPRTDHLPSQQRDGNWNTLPATNDANPAGAPPLDWWEIPTAPYAGSHYAVYPPALCERPIKAMCPLRVCTVCGQPSRRITGEAEYVSRSGSVNQVMGRGGRSVAGTTTGSNEGITRVAPTIGWTDCGHDAWRPGRTFDPFGGSGTTGLVATGHGRDCLLIDLDERNYDLAVDRVGPLMLRRADVDEAAAWLGARNEAAA